MSDFSPLPFENSGYSNMLILVACFGQCKEAMSAAMKYAKNSSVTLEMTKAGQRLINSASVVGKNDGFMHPSNLQRCESIVHVFRKAKINPMSIWKNIEEPILISRKEITKIIEHIIK